NGRRAEQPRGGRGDAPEHVVHHQRLADELLDVGEFAQPLGAARGVGEDARVLDGQRGLLGQPAQRRDLLLGERARRPVVHDQRPWERSGAEATALKPSRSTWARRSGDSHVSGSSSMFGVAMARPCSTERLIGPPPTGMNPASAYAPLSRPAARMTLNCVETPSQETTSADSAPMTSSAFSTIVSSTSLRSSEE